MSRYSPPELLATRHQLAGFRCRSKEQTTWLVEVLDDTTLLVCLEPDHV